MRRPIGIDVNGWRDFACRDWSAEDLEAPIQEQVSLDGGIRSVVVQHNDVHVGGPQAILSPIGRGGGWGEVGEPSRRRQVANLWAELLADTPGPLFDGDIRAAVRAMSQGADQRVVCIPDQQRMNEGRQKRLLSALGGPREPRAVLIWRSVALLLGLLDQPSLADAVEGTRVACLIQTDGGIERQHLVLRRLAAHGGILAPERDGPGMLCCSELGLDHLLDKAADAVALANPALAHWRAEIPHLPARLLFDEDAPQQDEIVRRDNGTWLRLQPPELVLAPGGDEIAGLTAGADLVVLLTPLASRHHSIFRVPRDLLFALPDSVARGALVAAQRMQRGIPHYLDRLDQVSLIVQLKDGPAFEDLIPPGETVEGNREYVSRPITTMVWTAGIKKVDLYVRKGPTEIRRWSASVDTAPERNERLEIRLRQTPAQGWATLSIGAPQWEALRRAPVLLDWNKLELEPRSEAEIIAALQGPRPAVPQRVRYPAHLGLWDGTLRKPSLAAILSGFRADDPACVTQLREALAGASGALVGLRGTIFPIDTDGEPPHSLDEATRRRFFQAIAALEARLLTSAGLPLFSPTNNDALRCLTWIFAASPDAIQQEVVAAFVAWQRGKPHPFLAPAGGSTVVIHGLGRIVHDADRIAKLLPRLVAGIDNTNVLGALASMLSRPHNTPSVLVGLDVTGIAEKLHPVLRRLNRTKSYAVEFKYALMVLAGLLRVREFDPWALTTQTSSVAKKICQELHAAAKALGLPGVATQGAATKRKFALELIEFLETSEGRPDILTRLDVDL